MIGHQVPLPLNSAKSELDPELIYLFGFCQYFQFGDDSVTYACLLNPKDGSVSF